MTAAPRPTVLARHPTRIVALALLSACGAGTTGGSDVVPRDSGGGFDAGHDATPDEPDADPGPDAHEDARATDAGPQRPPPNVVVVMADDLDARALDTLLARGFAPNIRRYVAEAGVTFANSFASNPLCCPSRASFLTGQYAHNTGVLTNRLPLGSVKLFRDGSTLATWLHAGGYRTGHVGKYLNLYGDVTADTYVPPGWDDWQATVNGTYRMYNFDVNDNGRLVHYGETAADYQTDVLARRAVAFIRESDQRNDAQPFFLVVTPLAPHGELDVSATLASIPPRPAPRHEGRITLDQPRPPSFDEADVSDKPGWIRALPRLDAADIDRLQNNYRRRLGSVLAVDDLVGSVVEALQSTGELANTVLVFTSDNGFLLGEHRARGKANAYEEAIRVPLLVRGPGFPAGRRVAQEVANIDLAPTIAALAGVTPGLAVDGRSLVPLLEGRSPADWRQRLLIEHREGEGEGGNDPPDHTGVRTSPVAATLPNRLYVRYPAAERELYDLGVDRSELRSLHADAAARGALEALESQRAALASCAGAACRTAEN